MPSSANADLLTAVAAQLAANRRRGVSGAAGGLTYDFVCPSTSHYPFQWFWDSCFHAIALTHVDVTLAEQELRCLLHGARPDGFIPHILFWERDAHMDAIASYNLPGVDAWTSQTIQPPVLATALRRVVESGGSLPFLEALLPTTMRYYDWLATNRDPDRDGLISILQPDESGLDASPKYDAVLGLKETSREGLHRAMDALFVADAPLRGDDTAMLALDAFNVEDVMVNCIYADALLDLAMLCDEAGESEAAKTFRGRAAATSHALVEKCWDAQAGAFWDLDGRAETPARVLTITSLFPLLLANLPEPIAAALVRQLEDPRRFACRYPVPSVAQDEPAFAPGSALLWRGATWINTNWFLVRGLRRHGRTSLADAIVAASRGLVRRHGFREYYDPRSGLPGGAHGFGWSTLVVDM